LGRVILATSNAHSRIAGSSKDASSGAVDNALHLRNRCLCFGRS